MIGVAIAIWALAMYQIWRIPSKENQHGDK